MKKLFYFVIAAVTTLVSCSSDDNGNAGAAAITITANASTVTLGSTVTFTVKNHENEHITNDATIYILGQAIEGHSIVADEVGTYTIQAKAGGHTSDAITVTVEGPQADNSLWFEGEEYATDQSSLIYLGSDTDQNLSYWVANAYNINADDYTNGVYLFFSTAQLSDVDIEYPTTGEYQLGNAGVKKMYNVQVFLDSETTILSKQQLSGGKLDITEFTLGQDIHTWAYDYRLTLTNGKRIVGNFHGNWTYLNGSSDINGRHAVSQLTPDKLDAKMQQAAALMSRKN